MKFLQEKWIVLASETFFAEKLEPWRVTVCEAKSEDLTRSALYISPWAAGTTEKAVVSELGRMIDDPAYCMYRNDHIYVNSDLLALLFPELTEVISRFENLVKSAKKLH